MGKRKRLTVITLIVLALISATVIADNPEIHSKHWLHGFPLGTSASNDMIIRDIYALSANDTTKFADWVAYRLTPQEVWGSLDLERRWRSDPWLADAETLETGAEDDYEGAFQDRDYDRGHLAPLATFAGSVYASQTNYLSNIVPQKKGLNRGPWRILEEKVREQVEKGRVIWVMTGPLYERDMPPLPNADEPHKVPSGYWKIILRQDPQQLRVAAFILDQDTSGNADLVEHVVSVDEVERRSRLDFLWELPDVTEDSLERIQDGNWILQGL